MGERQTAYLMVLEGIDTGAIYTLTALNTLGSDKDNTIVLNDRRISPHHASIYKKSDNYWLYQSEKADSLYLNGKKVQKFKLQHGDIITLATTALIYLEGHDRLDPAVITGRIAPMSPVGAEVLKSVIPQNYTKILEGHLRSKAGEHLRTLLDISIAISKIYDVEILLKHILSIVSKGFPADRGFIILVKPDKKCEMKAWFNKGERADFSQSKSITRKVLSRRASMLYNPLAGQTSGKYEDLSCLSVPLNCKGRLLGLIQLEAFSGYRFTCNDLEQLREIAVQTAIAIENLEIHQQPVRYHQHLISLERDSQTLSQSLDKEKIMEEGVRAARDLFDSTRVSILLSDENKTELKIAYAIGIPQQEWDTPIPIKESLAGRVFESNKPLLITNTHQLPSDLKVATGRSRGYRSLSCILAPIQVTHYSTNRQKTIGVICVTNKARGGSFTTLEKKLLMLLANQIGTAVTNAILYERATVDPLTKVDTRGFFFQKLQERVYQMRNTSDALSLLMMDLDYFKSVNDTYSHQAGDRVLTQLGKLLESSTRDGEAVGRYGGEEFLVLLQNNHTEAITRAGQLRAAIASYPFDLGSQTISMTSSIGVSTIRPTDTPNLLVERADQALYIAKAKGRNCVVSEREIGDQISFWDNVSD